MWIWQRLVVLLLLTLSDYAGRRVLGAGVLIHAFSQRKNQSGTEGFSLLYEWMCATDITQYLLIHNHTLSCLSSWPTVIEYNNMREPYIYSIACCHHSALTSAVASYTQGASLGQFKGLRKREMIFLALLIKPLRYRRVCARSPRIRQEAQCSSH